MKILDKIKDLVSKITEELTIEEVRPIVADIVDEIPNLESDVEALLSRVGELEEDVRSRDADIDKLREENGRLFRERIADITKVEKEEEEVEKDDEMSAEELRELFESMP